MLHYNPQHVSSSTLLIFRRTNCIITASGIVTLCKRPYSTVQYSTVQYSTAQHSTVQYSTPQHSTAQHSTVQHSTAQHSTAQHSTAQHSTVQHSTAQYSTVQYSTVQHSTVQYSTVQYIACLVYSRDGVFTARCGLNDNVLLLSVGKCALVSWLRQLVAGLPPRRPRFGLRSVHVRFVSNRVTL